MYVLLLLSHFSHVGLCATPSLGFSRQEHWSGLPFPSPMHKSEKWKWSRSVDCSLLGSSIHGIFQARVLEWDAIAFSVCMYYILFIHPSLDGLLGHFHLLAIVNSAVVNIGMGIPGRWEVKNPPRIHLPMQEMWVQSVAWEDPWEREMATHSSILYWEIPWTEEPGGLSPWGHR